MKQQALPSDKAPTAFKNSRISTNSKQTTDADQQLLSIRQVVKEFGASPWFWRNLIWSRELPVVQRARKYFLVRATVKQFIQGQNQTI